MLGFILLRHARSERHGKFWKVAYDSIRKFYPTNPIVILDDNSDRSFINEEDEKATYNTLFVQSEYSGRGEFLPYFYYLHLKFADVVYMLHDSVFVNSRLEESVDTYKILWSFEHYYDNPGEEKRILQSLDNHAELVDFYDKKEQWKGCFGSMCAIRHSYLKMLDERYNLSKLIPHIDNREARCHFERVIACILQFHQKNESLFGDIFAYCPWGLQFEEMESYRHLPVIKTWATR
jgi:hypothetical protein